MLEVARTRDHFSLSPPPILGKIASAFVSNCALTYLALLVYHPVCYRLCLNDVRFPVALVYLFSIHRPLEGLALPIIVLS